MTTLVSPHLSEPAAPPPAAAPAAPGREVPGPLAVRFVEPLLGFGDHRDFGLVAIDPEGVLIALRSLTEPSLRFVLTPARMFFDGYDPISGAPEVAAALGAEPGELRVLVLLTIRGDLADATANLRAPIVVADAAGTAVQVVLDDESLSMHAPILPVAPPV